MGMLLSSIRLSPGTTKDPAGSLGPPPPDVSAARVCQLNGVTDLGGYFMPAGRRPSKVMSKALRAAFHRLVQRLRPLPVGSRLMIARYRHLRAPARWGSGRGRSPRGAARR